MQAFLSREKLYIPDDAPLEAALSRVTHMGIGAHQDDLEIFAYHGIESCYRQATKWFAGVTVTDGGGSARQGRYADFNDEQMKQVRKGEQNRAAGLGEYAFQAQLGIPSAEIKNNPKADWIVGQIKSLLEGCQPEVVYLHNPADKHDTHIAVLTSCLEALRQLPSAVRPQSVYGCEVWRDLDWVLDSKKIALKVDRYSELAEELIRVFDSQVAGGKDYVQATIGRRTANATYFNPHQVDQALALTFALDLMPLVADPTMSLAGFIGEYLDDFRGDVLTRLHRYSKD